MKYGLIGEKLGHSFSKEIHEALGDYEYELCEIEPNKLEAFMRERDFLGINVTMPYKKAVIPYLDWIHEPARKIGAVNTIINCEGKLYGYNTDYLGMLDLINHAGIEVTGKKSAILGTGGTSKTAEAVLKALGASEIIFVSRSKKKGAIDYTELYEKHSDIEIIINTTPCGMYPGVFDCCVDISCFKQLSGVIDAVYNPINTTLLQNAKKNRIPAEGGLYMLTSQAVYAAELFMDENLPSTVFDKTFNEIKRKKENIILIGMPSSGKTTVGKIIAERLNRRFVDTDELISEKIKTSIKEFIALSGEERFREIESEIIEALAGENSLVIATGGGAVLRKDNISALKYNGKLFFIDRPLELLIPTESRPLSSDKEALAKRYEERYPIYCSVCDIRIDASCDKEKVCEKILENF